MARYLLKDLMNDIDDLCATSAWWQSKRVLYNISLVFAGLLAFVCYAFVLSIFSDVIKDAEITLFTILFQGIGYLVMMCVANVLYNLGPLLETKIKPKKVGRYRRITFRLGYWFSVSLPFCVPLLLLFFCLFFPEMYE